MRQSRGECLGSPTSRSTLLGRGDIQFAMFFCLGWAGRFPDCDRIRQPSAAPDIETKQHYSKPDPLRYTYLLSKYIRREKRDEEE